MNGYSLRKVPKEWPVCLWRDYTGSVVPIWRKICRVGKYYGEKALLHFLSPRSNSNTLSFLFILPIGHLATGGPLPFTFGIWQSYKCLPFGGEEPHLRWENSPQTSILHNCEAEPCRCCSTGRCVRRQTCYSRCQLHHTANGESQKGIPRTGVPCNQKFMGGGRSENGHDKARLRRSCPIVGGLTSRDGK
jgi:hypothetical protein